MDIFLMIGIIMGFFSVIVGMIVKGADVSVLLNPAAAIIIIVGLVAATINSFPKKDILRIPKIIGALFRDKENETSLQIIQTIIEMAQQVRKSGILSLESSLQELKNPFLKKGLEMVVDGMDPDQIQEILEIETENLEIRHRNASTIFKTAGSTSPTLGVLGAVIGLIGALGNLDDVDALGHMISAAFVATLYGIFFGYVILMPFSSRLDRKSQEEVHKNEIIIEGVLAIQAGNNPKTIERRLIGMLDPKEQKNLSNQKS